MPRARHALAAAVVLAAAIAAAGCSHDHNVRVRNVDDLVPIDGGKASELELVDGRDLEGRMVGGRGTAVRFQVRGQLLPRTIELGEIARLTVRRPTRGAIEGLVIGGLSALAAGVLLASVTAESDEVCTGAICTRADRVVAWGLAGGLAGAAIGAGVGFAIGSGDRFSIELAPAPAAAR